MVELQVKLKRDARRDEGLHQPARRRAEPRHSLSLMRACALDKLDQRYTHEAQEFTGTASRARVGR